MGRVDEGVGGRELAVDREAWRLSSYMRRTVDITGRGMKAKSSRPEPLSNPFSLSDQPPTSNA